MKNFTFGKWNTKLLYPLMMGFCSFLTLISNKMLRTVETGTGKHFYQKSFLVAWVMTLSEVVSIFFFKIQMMGTQKKHKQVRESHVINGILILEKDNTLLEVLPGKNKLNLFLKILPVCILDCVSILLLCVLRESINSFYELDYKALLIVVTSFFSYFILKFKMYWHHKFGTVLILAGIGVFTAFEIMATIKYDNENPITNKEIAEYNANDKKKELILCCILCAIIQICGGIQESLEKYHIDKNYVSPFIIVAFEGLIGNAIISIMFIPLSHIACGDIIEINKENVKEEVKKKVLHCNSYSSGLKAIEDILESILFVLRNKQYLLLLSLLFVSYMLFNVFRILTNSKCSPTHRAIADILGYFLYWLVRFINFFEPTPMHKYHWMLGFVCFAIIILGIFVYLELIIIHICGFKYNTDEEIMLRGQTENQLMLNSILSQNPIGHLKEDLDIE